MPLRYLNVVDSDPFFKHVYFHDDTILGLFQLVFNLGEYFLFISIIFKVLNHEFLDIDDGLIALKPMLISMVVFLEKDVEKDVNQYNF